MTGTFCTVLSSLELAAFEVRWADDDDIKLPVDFDVGRTLDVAFWGLLLVFAEFTSFSLNSSLNSSK